MQNLQQLRGLDGAVGVPTGGCGWPRSGSFLDDVLLLPAVVTTTKTLAIPRGQPATLARTHRIGHPGGAKSRPR